MKLMIRKSFYDYYILKKALWDASLHPRGPKGLFVTKLAPPTDRRGGSVYSPLKAATYKENKKNSISQKIEVANNAPIVGELTRLYIPTDVSKRLPFLENYVDEYTKFLYNAVTPFKLPNGKIVNVDGVPIPNLKPWGNTLYCVGADKEHLYMDRQEIRDHPDLMNHIAVLPSLQDVMDNGIMNPYSINRSIRIDQKEYATYEIISRVKDIDKNGNSRTIGISAVFRSLHPRTEPEFEGNTKVKLCSIHTIEGTVEQD